MPVYTYTTLDDPLTTTATFALGIMQGLASAKILDQFDYLSTVSGGGYIGSWLSSWARRHPRGTTGVQEELQRCDTSVAKDAHPTPRASRCAASSSSLSRFASACSPKGAAAIWVR